MINYIFGGFIIFGMLYSFFTGNLEVINESLLSSGSNVIDMIVKMIPLLCLWLGVMKIAEKSGLLLKLSVFFSKILHPLFPELQKDSKAISYIKDKMMSDNPDIKEIENIKVLDRKIDYDGIKFKFFVTTIESIGEVREINEETAG